jgi:DNA-binding CsgD family transcriptional regulator
MSNSTAEFLAREIRAGLHEYLTRGLTRYFPREGDEVVDLVQGSMTLWIGRDAFADRIAEGRPPTRRELLHCARNASANVLRDRGTDCQHRELRGARTERERAIYAGNHGGMAPWAHRPTSHEKIASLSDDGTPTDDGQHEIVQVAAATAEDALYAAELRAAARRTLIESCPRSVEAGERLARVFDLSAEGATPQKIAETLNISVLRANKLNNDVRIKLRAAATDVATALAALQAVIDGSAAASHPSVPVLVATGLATVHPDQTVTPTEKGLRRVRGEDGIASTFRL